MRGCSTTAKTIADLAKREIIVAAGKRGHWQLQPSVSGYVRHLRAEAAARGGEAGASARERLGQAQADLTETKAQQLRGELVEAEQVETKWTAACRAIRSRRPDARSLRRPAWQISRGATWCIE